jgi:methionyl-tRNA formyltransferase
LIRRAAEGAGHNIEVLAGVEDMAPLMAWADVAVSAGGTTVWELAFMGLPALLCIVADNQEGAVNALAKEGFPSAGWIKDATEVRIGKTLSELIHNKNLREKLAFQGRELVNGRGIGKTITEMSMKPLKVLFLGGSMGAELSEWLKSQGELVLYTDKKIDAKFVKSYSPDIIISYNYQYILKKDVLSIPGRGAVNLHISHLPWNRGANPNVWSFIENTPKGVTIHYIDEGIDTGDLLLQKEVPINEDVETLRTSYERLHKEIQELFKARWNDLKEGKIKQTAQPKEGTLHYAKDSKMFEPVLKEKGWDIPVKELKEKYELWGAKNDERKF